MVIDRANKCTIVEVVVAVAVAVASLRKLISPRVVHLPFVAGGLTSIATLFLYFVVAHNILQMTARKRLSPSSSQPRLVAKPSSNNKDGPPFLPSFLPRRQVEEKRLLRMLCWITVVMTMCALAVVFVVEQRARGRRQLGGSHYLRAGLETILQEDKSEISTQEEYQLQQTRHLNLMFQTKSVDAPACMAVDEDDVSFTLVTQCSDNRLWMINYHCERWSGPISLVVYTNQTAEQVQDSLHSSASSCNLDLLTVQVTPATHSMVDYPINALRNVALSAVHTSHAVYLDVDFWPADNLYEMLMQHQSYFAADNRRAVVLPAFALNRQCAEYRDCIETNVPFMPETQKDVFQGLVAKRITPFDRTNRGGHGSTLYADWFRQGNDQIMTIPCLKSHRYEPYLVFRYCQDLPPFQEGFTGYGKNKVSWVIQLRRAGWMFGQLGRGFVVHYPHLDSAARQAWNGNDGQPKTRMMRKPTDETLLLNTKRGFNDRLYVEFREWLDEHYPKDTAENYDDEHIRVPMCDGAKDDDFKLWIPQQAKEDTL